MSINKRIAVIGNPGVGKTLFIKSFNGKNKKMVWKGRIFNYVQAGNLDIIEFQWQDFQGKSLDFEKDFDMCVIMFDCTSRLSFRSAIQMKNEVNNAVVIGNKYDIKQRQVQTKDYIGISAKKRKNLDLIYHELGFIPTMLQMKFTSNKAKYVDEKRLAIEVRFNEIYYAPNGKGALELFEKYSK